jgi:uncharacterized protein (TIGR02466 family)
VILSSEKLQQAETLVSQGRAAEAFALTQPLASGLEPTHEALASHAVVLKALRRPLEALAFNQQATQRFPESGVAWHNLAATLGDLGRGDASRAAAEEAFRRGLDVSQTWSVYARALLAVGALDEAEQAYRECLLRAADDISVATEYANVIWMRRGDMATAQGVLDVAYRAGASPASLLLVKAKLLEGAGDMAGAARLLAMGVERMPSELPVLLAAAQAAVEIGAIADADRFAAQALRLDPDRPEALNQATIVELAAGRPAQALAIARRGLAVDPGNPSLWGWAATAARAAGDPLYGQVYDYDAMIGVYEIETPAGWASLEAYLADLARVLRAMHPYDQHPFHQSLRHGSQTMQPLTGTGEPALEAFFQAIDKPLHEHMAKLGKGSDPLRVRNTGKYLIDGAWSVSLKPGGFHKDHFHPQGWLSSAFYVETPDQAVDRGQKEGWIRFGQPPIKMQPPLPPERYVRPQPGRLVLFPSYMWHGTEPFTTDERRVTIAFDAVPG